MMTRKKQLDLAHTLDDLSENLEETIKELCPPIPDSFELAIEGFVEKYNAPSFSSLDELLEASLMGAKYVTSSTASLDDLAKDLLA